MIKTKDLYYELIEKAANSFKDHIFSKNNERIIFSGKFGIGKTTFLREFFKGENQKDLFGDASTYNVVKLYPVNYAIASNEDVFRYIKHDIILELLKTESDFKEEVVSYWKTAPEFLRKNAHKVLAGIIRMVPGVGGDIVDSFEMLDSLKEEFFKEHDEKNKEGSELQNLFEYVDDIKKSEGNVYEDDFITKIIERVLERKINEHGYRENILIIDDLDRIDPEHIFRILNIFSSHFDRSNPTSNRHKFGFNKIILVCDIKNIREIFTAKYGANTDFTGYIDKFYSKRIFEYAIKDEMAARAFQIINRANWNITENSNKNHKTFEYVQNSSYNAEVLLRNILNMLVENDQINIRNFKRFETESLHSYKIAVLHGDYMFLDNNITLLRIHHLSVVLGNMQSLKRALSNCYRPFKVVGRYDNLITEIVMCLNYAQTSKIGGDISSGFEYNINGKGVSLKRKDNNYSISDESAKVTWTFDDFKYALLDLVEMADNCRFKND